MRGIVVQGRAGVSARFIEIELKHVRLQLGGRAVLRALNWHISPGQRWVLLGANGAGKTQLLKLLAGDVWPAPGVGRRRYRLAGESFDDPYGIRDELGYLGAERQDRYEHYEWNYRVERIIATGLHRTEIPLAPVTAEDRRQIAELLSRLRIEALARRRFLTLSYGERRLVLLARALAWRPKMLLLDEPFTGLDAQHRERVMDGLRRLSRTALPWVLSTHRLEDVPVFATHVCRIESGRITGKRRFVRQRRSRKSGLRVAHARSDNGPPRPPAAPAPALISLRRASVWREGRAVLRDLSLQVRRSECWLVHGANGSGKSSFLQMLYGDLRVARGGSITRAGLESGVALHAFKRRLGLIAPELQALHPRYLPVADVVASGLHASVGLNERSGAGERRRVARALRRVGAANLAARTWRTLSYGQQRRLLFARALVHEPDILLLDEPYAGLDIRTHRALRALVEQAIAAGVTTIMATHHRDEWPARVTHELELVRGRAAYCGPVRAP
jgi:molybdate transport system ATP-binding protein